MRRSTSLVEVLVFGLLGLVVIAIALGMMQRTMRQSARTQERLRGLGALGLLSERLAQDLSAGAAYRDRAGKALRATVAPDGRAVELFRYDPDPKAQQPLVPLDAAGAITPVHVERVTYTFDPARRVVLRQLGTGRPETLPNRFVSVRFASAAAGDARLLALHVDWIPEERLDRPSDERGEAARLECMLGLEGDAAFDHHPHRVLNPTSKFTL